MSCVPKAAKKTKKNHRGLATFDKKNYFPINFVDHNKDHDKDDIASKNPS
jgi:hypothetical protein